MPCPAAVVADAAQMYEEVPPSRVRSGLRSLITCATDRGYTRVAVYKRTAGPSLLARQKWRHPPGTVLFTWEGLSQGLDLALAQNAISIGDSVWVQAEGLPIVRLHSQASCSVVLELTMPPGLMMWLPAPGTASLQGDASLRSKSR